ncbi:MAG: CDP-diacylglycerol--serine O-phosphatidyltransferase [Spirochaetes bacterium]|nr:CDP-diacylglycerol--serine O-phosphatidyltransferase [Spirochaetota bacterium]
MIKKKSMIPSMVTMGNMVAGFFSILYSAQYDPLLNNVETLIIAGALIFVASIFDAVDGAVARALNVESELGMQLDSLADAVSYGIAPGILAYSAYFYKLPSFYGIGIGALLSVIFPICAIYRLARFNCQDSGSGFKGLPSPAAGIIVGIVPALLISDNIFLGQIFFEMPMCVFIVLFVASALLMVSNIDYSKFFSDVWKKGKPAIVITTVVFLFLLITSKAWAVFVVTMIYILWGIFRYIYRFFVNSRA